MWLVRASASGTKARIALSVAVVVADVVAGARRVTEPSIIDR